MKVKLLKKLRRNCFVEERNGRFKGVKESGWFSHGFSSGWCSSESSARNGLNYYIMAYAPSKYTKAKSIVKL